MELPVIHIYTHDSIGVGEDGPTHQPVEHLASLRAMPGLIDIRPGDANEVAEAWRFLMPLRHEPVAQVRVPSRRLSAPVERSIGRYVFPRSRRKRGAEAQVSIQGGSRTTWERATTSQNAAFVVIGGVWPLPPRGPRSLRLGPREALLCCALGEQGRRKTVEHCSLVT
jgi:deoxyxylulose-5-phosphate synthase